MERFKNYGLWVSVAALIPLVLHAFGINVIPDYNEIVSAVLGILVTAGIISNPTTTNKWFGDDKPTATDTTNTPPQQ